MPICARHAVVIELADARDGGYAVLLERLAERLRAGHVFAELRRVLRTPAWCRGEAR